MITQVNNLQLFFPSRESYFKTFYVFEIMDAIKDKPDYLTVYIIGALEMFLTLTMLPSIENVLCTLTGALFGFVKGMLFFFLWVAFGDCVR